MDMKESNKYHSTRHTRGKGVMSRPLIKKKKGFALMTAERRREVGALGGRATSAKGKAHKFTSQQAVAAGRKGGTAISANREHMAALGRLASIYGGGQSARIYWLRQYADQETDRVHEDAAGRR